MGGYVRQVSDRKSPHFSFVEDGGATEITARGRADDAAQAQLQAQKLETLGLAAVLGLVRSHDGASFVASPPGKGTTGSVHRPVASGAAQVENVAPQARRILVVDDEPIVVVAVKGILELEGYAVATAHGGLDAIEMFRREPDGFIGVVLDMTMPRLGGIEVMRELRAIRADVQVILMSGYEWPRASPLGDPPAGFLHKPFRSEDLLDAVARLFAR